MQDARLYAKIMKHLEEKTGTGFWDFRTLNMVHPQLALYINKILVDVVGESFTNKIIQNHYIPRRLWNYL